MEATPGSVAPRILSRPEHIISRKNIDPDALKVLYRLKNNGFVAYLVGGGVRDLLLERQPKDFDIGTSAHPQQVSKLFRNCFIVGRRFRLAHVRFGRKVVEVSTFRRAAEPEEGDTLIRRDNTFGTPEEDAFRRDFTVNALFYDIATFSVIDWVGGLEDLEARVIRTIGDPEVRFREDPVRMLRAVALAARLDFTIDRDTAEADPLPARARSCAAAPPASSRSSTRSCARAARARTFEMLHEYGLLAYLLPEADRAIAAGGEALLGSPRPPRRLPPGRPRHPRPAHEPAAHGLAARAPRRAAAAGGGAAAAPSAPRREPGDAGRARGAARRRGGRGRGAGRRRGARKRRTPGPGGRCPSRSPSPAATSSGCGSSCSRSGASARRTGRPPPGGAMAARRATSRTRVRWLEIHGGDEGRELAAQWRGARGRARPSAEPAGAESRRPRPALPRTSASGRAAAAAAAAAVAALGAGPAGLTAALPDRRTSHGPSDRDRDPRAPRSASRAGSGAGSEIRRTWTFPDFQGSMAFVNRVAELAEAADHHPDIDIRYSKVTLALSTHDAGGPHRARLRARRGDRRVRALVVGVGRPARARAGRAPRRRGRLGGGPRRDRRDRRRGRRPRSCRASRPDVVFNATAYNRVDAAEAEPEAAFAVNAAGPPLPRPAARERGALLVHFSTDYVFDGTASRPYREDDAPRPLGVYGASKLAGEHLVAAAGGEHLVVRTSGVLGRGGSEQKGGSFVERIVAQARAGEPLRVVADQVFAPTCAADLARRLARPRAGRGPRAVPRDERRLVQLARAARGRARPRRPRRPGRADHGRRPRGCPPRRPAYSVLACERYRALGLPPLRPWRTRSRTAGCRSPE